MKIQRGILLHLGLLAVSSSVALAVWASKQRTPEENKDATVSMWRGQPQQIKRIAYENGQRRVVMRARRDKVGIYLLGEITTTPHRDAIDGPDAGAGNEHREPTRAVFIAGASAKNFLEKVASLHAVRAIGKVGANRVAEFGLDSPNGTVVISEGTQTHRLTIGGLTPGGLDRYVRDGTGQVFAIPGSVLRDIRMADSRLMQRDLHAWEPDEATSVEVETSQRRVKFVRVEGTKSRTGWAPASSPKLRNETVENWMSKLGRLRGLAYAAEVEDKEKREPVVTVTYFGQGGERLGFVTLLARGNKDAVTYFVRSEQSRLPMRVLTTSAKQVRDDLGSVLR